jgi:hypothetical protein
MASLLNKKLTKQYILNKVSQNRPGWACTRVSAKALHQIDAFLRIKIEEAVKRHPTLGKTFVEFQS